MGIEVTQVTAGAIFVSYSCPLWAFRWRIEVAISLPMIPLIARFMWPTWGPSGADRTEVGPMLAPWTLLSGTCFQNKYITWLIHLWLNFCRLKMGPTIFFFLKPCDIMDLAHSYIRISHQEKSLYITEPLWVGSTSHQWFHKQKARMEKLW